MAQDTRFKKGQSGNPAGRGKGVGTRGARLKKALEDEADLTAVVDKLKELALNGDMTAIKVWLDKVKPSVKPVSLSVEVPMPEGSSLAEKSEIVTNAILSGGIPVDLGAQLSTVLMNHARIIESHVLEERIAALEEQQNG